MIHGLLSRVSSIRLHDRQVRICRLYTIKLQTRLAIDVYTTIQTFGNKPYLPPPSQAFDEMYSSWEVDHVYSSLSIPY